MFDKLKKLLEGGIAQANIFDGGKTYQSVVNNRTPQQQNAVQQQQAQARTFRQPGVAPQQTLTNKLRDILDANTEADKFRRAQVNQSTDYATQQREEYGVKRAPMNVGSQLFGNAARFANTAGAALGEIQDTSAVYGANVADAVTGGNQTSRVLEEVNKRQQARYNPKSGIFGAGTWFDNQDDFRKSTANPLDLAKKAAVGTIGTAFEVGSMGAGQKVAKLADVGLKQFLARGGKAAAARAVEGVIADAASQKFERDRYSPEQSAIAAVASAGLPIVARGAAKVLRPVVGAASDALGRIKPRSVAEIAQEVNIARTAPAIAENAPAPSRVSGAPTPRPASEIAAELAASKARSIDPNVAARRASFSPTEQVAQIKRVNVSPDDQRILADFNDIANGVYKPDARLQRQIELDATRIAEKYNIPLRSTALETADEFDNFLQRGVTKPEFAPKPPRQTNQLAPKPSKTDPLEALKAEARKYKSADTFAMNIKDKEVGDNLVVYKGAGGDLDMGGATGFDYLKKVGDSQKDMPKNTSSFSQDKFFARQYGDVTPYTVPKKDIMPREDYSKLIGGITGVGDNSGTALRGMWRRADKYPSVIPDVKKAGYKGFTDVNGEIVMFDRSSLTDLYNQATKPKAYYQNVPKSYTEPKATIQEPAFKPGQTVRSAERDNVGKVIGKQNADGTYNVRFVNKAEGTEATIKLKQEEIVGGGAPITTQATPGEIKISSAAESNKVGARQRLKDGREQLVNRFAPVEDLVSKIEKETGAALRPSKNPLSYVRQYLGGGGIANAKIDDELTPIIKQTKEFDGLREYLVAKRMNELADRGMSKRADDVLEGINKKYGAEVGNFEKVAKELYAYQNKQIEELVDVGVLTREAADNIRAKNQYYVPFNRVIPELEDFAGTTPGNAIGRNGNPIKAIHGSDKDIIDPIESMIRNTYDIQATVQKQKVMRSLYELAPDEFRVPARDSMNKNRVGMFLDGKKTILETSEPLARALNSMAEEQMNYAVKVMSIPAKMLRSGATSLNVAFALPNIVRDQLSAAVNSKYGGIPIYDFISGLSSVIAKDDSYKKWILSGADQASFFAQDRTTLQRGVKDITGGAAYKVGKYVRSPLELFRVLGEFSEKGSRVGVYKRAEKGAMKEFGNAEDAVLAAAKESREATIDFARRGSKMKAANSLIPFLNARLQGTLKLANSFKERPVQTGAVGMAIAGLPAAALYIHNSEYPEYAEIPDYIKRENFIIMTGSKETPFIKIPKGEVGKIFGNPVESFLAQAKSDDPSWKSTAASIVDSFLPVGSVEDPGKFVTDLMPTAASVPLQMTANFDTFRGMPIVSQWQKDLPPEQQFTSYNTETGKKIGAALGVSPAMLEFGIGGLTGGLGRQGLQIADMATGNKIPTQDLPVVSRFAGEQKDLNKSAGEVYDQIDKDKRETARANYDLKQALKKGDTSGLEGMDKTKANRLKRSVKEDEIKKTLSPTEKALWQMSKEDLENYSGKYEKEASKVLGLKDTLSSSKEAKTNKEKYEAAQEEFDNPDNGYSRVEKVKKREELKRLTVQKDYDEDTTMLHGMSKEDVWGFLSTYEDGKAMADKLLALDDALTAAGVQDKNKFRDKYGNVAIKPKEKSSGKGGSKAKTVKGQAEAVSSERKLRALLANTNNKASYRKPATQSAKIGLKKFAVKSAGITSRKGV